MFPDASVTDWTCAVGSFQPTTTTLRLAVICADGYGTLTDEGSLTTDDDRAWTNVTRPLDTAATFQTNETLEEVWPSDAEIVTG